jgi:hypothetical protein
MAADRFFCAPIVGGQLYFAGLSDWDSWDPTKFIWRTDAEIAPQRGDPVRRINLRASPAGHIRSHRGRTCATGFAESAIRG